MVLGDSESEELFFWFQGYVKRQREASLHCNMLPVLILVRSLLRN